MKLNIPVGYKKQWLQWVLDFIGTDLTSLKQPRKEELIDQLVYFTLEYFPTTIFSYDDEEYYENHYCPPPEKRGGDLNTRFAMAELNLGKIQETFRDLLNDIEGMASKPRKEHWLKYELCETSTMLLMGGTWTEEQEGSFDITFIPKEKDDLICWVKLNFARLLRDLPFHAITRCKGCGKHFLNLTERKKIYCNSSCASRSIAKRKREELKKDPDAYRAYLDKQSEYTMKRYIRLKQMQYGPNVKIGRKRIRKKKHQ